jgi:hypothetical protein
MKNEIHESFIDIVNEYKQKHQKQQRKIVSFLLSKVLKNKDKEIVFECLVKYLAKGVYFSGMPIEKVFEALQQQYNEIRKLHEN